MKWRVLPILGFTISALTVILWEGHALGQDSSTNSYIDFGWPAPTQRVYFSDMFGCLTNVTNNCYAHLAPGWYTYVKSNAIPGGSGAFQYLVSLVNLTNFVIAGSPGTRFIFDNTCTTDSPNTIVNLFNFDGAANGIIQNLEIETKRRYASQSNINFDCFAGSMPTNILIQNIHAQQDWYVMNGPVEHADAFLVSVSGDSANLVVNNCQYGVVVPPGVYNINYLGGQCEYSIDHGNSGSLTYSNCVLYGMEFGELDESQGTATEPEFINFRVRYPGALVARYLNIYASDFTNASVWFNEQQNLSYYLSGTDPIFLGYDQYTNLDSVSIYFPATAASARFSAAPTSGAAPLTVTFVDTSVGSITNWFWDFGDGCTTNLTETWVSHTYASTGTFTVTEIISVPGGTLTNAQMNDITVSWPAPSARFTAAPTAGVAPLTVTFADASTGNITNWCWSFGDGTTTNATVPSMEHTYTAGGTYDVTEIVSGPSGVSTARRANYITTLSPAEASQFQAWLTQYFSCTNCVLAQMGADADGTGQNNLFKYTAGLDPTNPASVFVLSIASVPNQPQSQNLVFHPVVGGRTYRLQFSADVVNGVWLPLATCEGPVTNNGNQVTITDTNPIPPQGFYRIDITSP